MGKTWNVEKGKGEFKPSKTPPNFQDLTGITFGRLTIIERDYVAEQKRIDNNQRPKVMWRCKCECGNEISVIGENLKGNKRGHTKSCGCLQLEQSSINGKNTKQYNKWIVENDITYGITNKGEKFIIDTEDLEKVKNYCWRINKEGYVVTTINFRKNNKKTAVIRNLHRTILNVKGRWNLIDHKDGNKLDNRKCNLRECSASENNSNKEKSKYNKSGFTGVRWDKTTNKWVASISCNKKEILLGNFNNKKDAIQSRYDAEIKYHGEFSGELCKRKDYEKVMEQENNNKEGNDNGCQL